MQQLDTLVSPVRFTSSAADEIKRLISLNKNVNPNEKIRIGVKGGGCSGLTYVLEFDSPTDSDNVFEIDGLEFIMNGSHEMYLYGIQIDWSGGLNSRGFTFNNPNAQSTCGCGTSFSI